MNDQNNTEENTTSADLHYSWVGYQADSPEEDQDQRTLILGGDSLFVHAEVVYYEDGSMALKVLSNGIENKFGLVKFIESMHTIAQHDYLETQKASRE